MVQRESLSTLDGTLGPHFAVFDDVLLTGETYARADEEDASELAPDFIFARQVSDTERVIRRNGFVISEVGKPPDLVLEVGSRSTGRRNFTVKRKGYAALGIGECWRFNPSGGEHPDVPHAWDTLVDGECVPVEIVAESDGRHWGYSETLELELWWEDRDAALPRPCEREVSSDARKRARGARICRDSYRTAEARVAELEAELRRLRGE